MVQDHDNLILVQKVLIKLGHASAETYHSGNWLLRQLA